MNLIEEVLATSAREDPVPNQPAYSLYCWCSSPLCAWFSGSLGYQSGTAHQGFLSREQSWYCLRVLWWVSSCKVLYYCFNLASSVQFLDVVIVHFQLLSIPSFLSAQGLFCRDCSQEMRHEKTWRVSLGVEIVHFLSKDLEICSHECFYWMINSFTAARDAVADLLTLLSGGTC